MPNSNSWILYVNGEEDGREMSRGQGEAPSEALNTHPQIVDYGVIRELSPNYYETAAYIKGRGLCVVRLEEY